MLFYAVKNLFYVEVREHFLHFGIFFFVQPERKYEQTRSCKAQNKKEAKTMTEKMKNI